MRIPPEEIKALVESSLKTTRRPKRKSIARSLAEARRLMSADLDQYMQASFVLFDEAVRFIMSFEEFQFSRELKTETSAFALQTARLRSDLLAIREMVRLGQESAAQAMSRVFFEDIEIAMALAIDSKFAIAYSESAGEDAFWSKHIGYGKIYGQVRQFLEMSGCDSQYVQHRLLHHKKLKTFLSGHIHPTTSSAFDVVFSPALAHPGMFHRRPLGSLGKNLRPLCLTLADEVAMFAACCINMLIRPDTPAALPRLDPCGELDDFIASAHILQQLHMKYFEPLWREHIEASEAWEAGIWNDEAHSYQERRSTCKPVIPARIKL